MELDVVRLTVGPFQQNCRVVRERQTGEGVIVDPGDEADRILEAAERLGARVRYVLATHAHIDHVGAAAEVQRALGVPFALHAADLPLLTSLPQQALMFGLPQPAVPRLDIDLAETKTLPFAGGEIRVVDAPGHTAGGVILLFDHEGFFGDSLFQGSVGRVDLPGGDAKTYARTLRDVVLALPDETVVYAGHGPDTTIATERRLNPYLNGQIRIDEVGFY